MAGTQTALRLKSLLKDNFETLYHHGSSCSTRMMGGTGYSGVAASSLEQKLCNGHSARKKISARKARPPQPGFKLGHLKSLYLKLK
jgi:hypothetical protein